MVSVYYGFKVLLNADYHVLTSFLSENPDLRSSESLLW